MLKFWQIMGFAGDHKMTTLSEIAGNIVSKGILAMDESQSTISKRLEAVNLEPNPKNIEAWRETIVTTSQLEVYISAAILAEPTLGQILDGTNVPEYLNGVGIIPGIKVDLGTERFLNSSETFTKGLDGLAERLSKYKGQHPALKFTKWRATYIIGEDMPSGTALLKNANDLASYAKIVQDAGLVPIVEPEVLMNGGHDIARSNEEIGRA